MKPKHHLIKSLHVLFIICEISAALGLVAVMLMAPFLKEMVRSGRANVGLYAGHGSLDWNFEVRLPRGTNSSFVYGTTGYSRPGIPDMETGFGKMSFGPIRLHMDKGESPMEARNMKDRSIAIDQIEGTVTLLRPEVAAQALVAATWPFVVGMLCTGGVGLAILDLLRRMLRSVGQREVFTAANIRNVQCVGFLLMASAILKLASGAWLVSRMSSFVMQQAGTGNISLETSSPGNVTLATGLLILALAEVFRQGLILKEDNQLTI
jgi:hypothetical protein